MTPNHSSQRAKVILGATCYVDAEAALRIASILAKHISADLHGCLVEDDAILASAATPNARTLTYSGRSLQRVTVKSMQAAFKADAKLFKDKLNATTHLASIESTFKTARGRLPNVLLKDAGSGDFVVFGFRRIVPNGDQIVLDFGDTIPDQSILQLGAKLSQSLNRPLTLFAASKHKASILAALSKSGGVEIDFHTFSDTATFLRDVERMSPAVLIIGHKTPDFSSALQLLEIARCPIIVPIRNHELPENFEMSSQSKG